jgi:hypothetical protein
MSLGFAVDRDRRLSRTGTVTTGEVVSAWTMGVAAWWLSGRSTAPNVVYYAEVAYKTPWGERRIETNSSSHRFVVGEMMRVTYNKRRARADIQ